MIVGVPKEIKDNEYRVGLTPASVRQLVDAGHSVLVETGAGEGSGFSDDDYRAAGASIVASAAEAWGAEMVVKVKEPLPQEYDFLRPDLILFTYLHLAADERLTLAMRDSGVIGIAYETVELPDGRLPLLTPMSEVAGRMAVQVGAYYLEKMNGGRGKLLGGVPGVRPATVVIIGGGVVGTNAAKIALGMGANVVILDINVDRLRYLEEIFGGRLTTIASNTHNIAEAVKRADLLIGAVLVKGAKAPKLVTREMVSTMKPGSVIVDVAVDQGGCIETTRPTTHSNPTFFVDGVLHYCVANMPGAVPRTSTYALNNATLPYTLKLAAHGLDAIRQDPALAKGVNVFKGHITYPAVAEAFGLPYTPLETLLAPEVVD
ncbi:alanine dehydrogenase [Ardenticatena maritima]|uniref:Alanine dehydrogenase n=1 Tax=Ardenticatena maritima TaxID=872965 RepID=A0A0M8K9I6_9CHLR|nr:alanine dehydrogenase [Ardenticatena maritima]KPL88646.1 alanine dehydrogenase [Ardenticatena maritima]GAP63502.1 alanine dehydrogenase [Ardenticatena maritima]